MFILAEIGTNWYPQMEGAGEKFRENALANVMAVAENADGVKLQLFTASTLYSTERAQKLYNRVAPFAFPASWVPDCADTLHKMGKQLWASIFYTKALEVAPYLDGLKIASSDLMNLKLIHQVAQACASYSKPLIISTGAAYPIEIHKAIDTVLQTAHDNIPWLGIMACVSTYPANWFDYRLAPQLSDFLKLCASDHTRGDAIGLIAASLGYDLIEKHVRPQTIWYSTEPSPPDWDFALNPEEFREWTRMVRQARKVAFESALDGPLPSEASERIWARRGADGLRPVDGVRFPED